MDQQVKYTVTANDMLSGKLQGMNSSAQALEGTMGGLSKIMGTLGIGFAVFKGLEFVHSGVDAFHELEQSTAKIEANLESTGAKAGMNLGMVEGYAKELSSHIQASRADALDMASQLLTFPSITKDVFESSMGMVADIAKQTNHGLSETAIMYGKALANPTEGLQKMQRYGVILTEQEKQRIVKLQESGHLIQSQKAFMDAIAHSGYAGVATAMFNADPLAKFNKMMGSLKLGIGEAATELLKVLLPTLEKIGNGFKTLGGWVKDGAHWLKEHKNTADFLKVTLSTSLAVFLAYQTAMKVSAYWTGVATTSAFWYEVQLGYLIATEGGATMATGLLAGATAGLNAIMDANPVMLVVIAIGLLVGTVYEIVQNFYDWGAAVTFLMGPIGWVIGAVMSLYSHWQSIKDAFNNGGIVAGLKRIGIVLLDTLLYPLQQVMEWVAKITGADWAKGAADSIREMRKQMDLIVPEETAKKTGLASARKAGVPTAVIPTDLGKAKKDKSKDVSGSKVVTINISIGNLINDFQIKTTNIQESANAVHDKIVQALTSAVNDSQIISGS